MSSPKTCARASEASERERDRGGRGGEAEEGVADDASVENLGQLARSRSRALTVVIASKTKGSTFASHSCQAFRRLSKTVPSILRRCGSPSHRVDVVPAKSDCGCKISSRASQSNLNRSPRTAFALRLPCRATSPRDSKVHKKARRVMDRTVGSADRFSLDRPSQLSSLPRATRGGLTSKLLEKPEHLRPPHTT